MKKHILISCLALMTASTGLFAQNYSEYDVEDANVTREKTSTEAVSSVSGDELYKTVSTDLQSTLVGKLQGLTVMEGSGEMGNAGARYIIRGMGSYGLGSWNTAKVFVDGFQVHYDYLTSMSPSEIESVTVLKDAAALAIYGERGANGVIVVKTKRGVEGKLNVTAKVRYGAQTPANLNKPLDSYEYAQLYNQAVSNDKGMVWSPAYSADQLAAYKSGKGINVDWYDQALRNAGNFVDGEVVLNGGVKNARYNINLNYLNNNGLLNTRNTDKTRNLDYSKYNLRANLDFSILKIFDVRLDMNGRIEDLFRPNYGISNLFNDLARYPSNIYNVYDDEQKEHYSGTAVYPNNPYASVNGLGWQQYRTRSLQTNLHVKERLDAVTPGLYLEQAFSFFSQTLSAYSKTRNYARWNEGVTTTTDETTTIVASGYGSNGMKDWKQGRVAIGYDHDFGKHLVNAKVNFDLSAYKGNNHDAYRYKYNTMNLNGYVHYEYDSRYVFELSASYFGNDAYAKGKRWAVYPAGSFAWVISNEEFLKNNPNVSLLKLRLSAGQTGTSDSNATGVLGNFNTGGRYMYKDYFTYSYIGSFYTGKNQGTWQNTYVPMFIPNQDIRAERSTKFNVGFDATVLGGLDFTVDAYLDKRNGILTLDNSLMNYYGKQYYFSNIGKMTSYGVEASIAYTGKAGDFRYNVHGMASFNRNKVDYMAEVAPANAFSAKTGRPYGSIIGLVADGFYDITDFDANGNLLGQDVPAFGNVQPGDIKYKDLDGNHIIDQNDVTRIGRSEYPEWYFSFGTKLAWKGLDFELLFQGAAGVSANILDNWNQTVAFVDNGNAYPIAKGAWAYYPTEGIDNRAGATYPRLTTQSNPNNYQTSSFWVEDASFLKLRNVEIGYDFFYGRKVKGVQSLRLFLNAHNVCTISPMLSKYNIDPENLSGMYPMLRNFNVGLTVTF